MGVASSRSILYCEGMRRVSPLACSVLLVIGCSSPRPTGGVGGAGGAPDAGVDASNDAAGDSPVTPPPDGSLADPCSLPGTLQFTATGTILVPGGSPTAPSLDWLTLPQGFCAHYYGTVGDARQIRFAPGGELFVASPTALTTGGNASAGLNEIVVLPDDNLDGVADSILTFLSFTPVAMGMGTTTQGMLFAPGYFYYQDGNPPGTKIFRVPYASGDRMPSGPSEQVADITVYTSGLHWPKTLDMADDGTIYVGNGGDQAEACVTPHPFHGGILSIDAAPGGANPNGVQIAQGLRNPIAVRCYKGHGTCFALELAKDYTDGEGGREKMIPLHKGDDWGFPCCATQNVPYLDSPTGTNCSTVTPETNSFIISETPFNVDFEAGKWSGKWANQAYVVLHGAFPTWTGARMVAIPMSTTTGLPMQSTDLDGGNVGMSDFATGWDDGSHAHGRPAAVAFSSDGRLFVANDNTGVIFWIAQQGL
jgi:glucose/arabinose dehydrogenase